MTPEQERDEVGIAEAADQLHYDLGCTPAVIQGRDCPRCRGDVKAVLAAYDRGCSKGTRR